MLRGGTLAPRADPGPGKPTQQFRGAHTARGHAAPGINPAPHRNSNTMSNQKTSRAPSLDSAPLEEREIRGKNQRIGHRRSRRLNFGGTAKPIPHPPHEPCETNAAATALSQTKPTQIYRIEPSQLGPAPTTANVTPRGYGGHTSPYAHPWHGVPCPLPPRYPPQAGHKIALTTDN